MAQWRVDYDNEHRLMIDRQMVHGNGAVTVTTRSRAAVIHVVSHGGTAAWGLVVVPQRAQRVGGW